MGFGVLCVFIDASIWIRYWAFQLPRRFCSSEDKAPSNSSESIASCDGSSKGSSFPLANDIRSLVGIHCCPVADICACGQIRSYIPNCNLRGEAEHAKTGDSTNAVESDDEGESPKLVAITNNRRDDDRDDSVERPRGA
jgi:hypothetical protein